MTVIEEKVSVIIPVYNCRAWVKRCLDSVLEQTYQNLEVLVIDDGSEDGSAEIIESLARKDSRVQYFFQSNQGVASARNRGLMEASGGVITFVDADDYIEKDMYEKMLTVMKMQDADIVECSCRRVRPDGKTIVDNHLKEETVIGKRQCVRHYLRQENVTNYVCNKVYRKELFHGFSFPNLKYSEDYYINNMVHARAEKKVIMPEIYYNYVLYEGQATDINHVSLSNFDGVKAGRLVAEYFRKDRELCTYAAVYACEYAVRTAGQYLSCCPGHWNEVRKQIRNDFLYCYRHVASADYTGIDVKAKRRQYLHFFRKGEIERGIFVPALPELAKREKQQQKSSRLLKLMCRWTMDAQKGMKPVDYLIKRSWYSVAVYGVGDVGKCLLSELADSAVTVKYVIDRRQLELDLPVYTPEDDLPAVDCIIVTAVTEYGEISRRLKKKLDCQVISIEDIIYQVE